MPSLVPCCCPSGSVASNLLLPAAPAWPPLLCLDATDTASNPSLHYIATEAQNLMTSANLPLHLHGFDFHGTDNSSIKYLPCSHLQRCAYPEHLEMCILSTSSFGAHSPRPWMPIEEGLWDDSGSHLKGAMAIQTTAADTASMSWTIQSLVSDNLKKKISSWCLWLRNVCAKCHSSGSYSYIYIFIFDLYLISHELVRVRGHWSPQLCFTTKVEMTQDMGAPQHVHGLHFGQKQFVNIRKNSKKTHLCCETVTCATKRQFTFQTCTVLHIVPMLFKGNY